MAALTAEQVEFFNREGYFSPIRALEPNEAADCRRRIEDYEKAAGENVNKRLKIKAHLAYPWMVDLAKHPKVIAAVSSLIGPDILLFGSSAFAKDARCSKFVSWHQDSAYYGLDPHREVTAWMAFSRSNQNSGCLRVIPRSHLGPDLVHEETYDPNNLLSRGQTVRVDESEAVDMPLEPGEFSLHHERTVHGSLANPSDDRRIGLAFFYMPTSTRSTMGRRSALLVAGEDKYNYWDKDVTPTKDLDPVSLAFLDSVWGQYRDENSTPQVAKSAA